MATRKVTVVSNLNDTSYNGDDLNTIYTGSNANNEIIASRQRDTLDTMNGGSGNDTLLGNGGNDVLNGGAGIDVLVGGAGDDTLTGGAGADELQGSIGDDTFFVTVTNNDEFVFTEDSVSENAGEGNDTVILSGTFGTFKPFGFTLDSNPFFGSLRILQNIENIDVSGVTNGALYLEGNIDNNKLTGNALANTLVGGRGDDTLIGGAGIDSFEGGEGSDTYFLENSELSRFLDVGGVSDTVVIATNANINLADLLGVYAANDIENVNITGTGNFNLTGNADNNRLEGNAGSNRIIGAEGVDTLIGGAGNDTYELTVDYDQIIELANGGTDTVIVDVNNYSLADNVEKLILRNNGALDRQLAQGNASANTMTADIETATELLGLAGNDTLKGGNFGDTLDGGLGNDSMTGGSGDDTYRIGSAADKVFELNNGGIDTVETTINYTLLNQFEQLIFLGETGLKGTGNSVDNTIISGIGNDTIDGAGGFDNLQGGDGNDTLTTDITFDSLAGVITLLDNTLFGGSGEDTLKLRGSFKSANALTFNLSGDFLQIQDIENLDATATGTSKLNLVGNEVNNILTGNATNNSITGDDGNDTLNGAAGNDTLIGDAGNDVLEGGAGKDSLIGGAGDDTYIVDATDIVFDELEDGGIDKMVAGFNIEIGKYLFIENLELTGKAALKGTGNALNNNITGNVAANTLFGGFGADTLFGNAGADTLVSNDNSLDNDIEDGSVDVLDGGAGNDLYLIGNGDIATDSADSLTGGIDTVKLSSTFTGNYTLTEFIENLDASWASGTNVTYSGNNLNNVISGVFGSFTINGLGGKDLIRGGANNDELNGGDGLDTLNGGLGNDTLNGGGNDGFADVLIGGSGNDTYIISSSTATLVDVENSIFRIFIDDKITEVANGGIDTINLSGNFLGNTKLTFTLTANIEILNATTISGGLTLDLIGNTSNNTITGNNLNNVISGLTGNDILIGGGGADTLFGGAGQDTLTGGSGNDTFVFKATSESTVALKDTITEFTTGDIIDLSAIDANTKISGNQAFTSYLGESAFTGVSGQLRYEAFNEGGPTLFGDVNGDRVADFAIILTGVAGLTLSDFVL